MIFLDAYQGLARDVGRPSRPDVRLRALFSTAALCMLAIASTASVAQHAVNRKESADLHFGEAVSVVGNSALVASPYGTDGRSAGLAYIFEQTAPGWKRTATLSAKDERRENGFGSPLAYANATALVGAWRIGTAYIFERAATGWDQVAVFSHSDAGNFGRSVALEQATAIVGAPGVRDTAHRVPAWSGAVYNLVEGSNWLAIPRKDYSRFRQFANDPFGTARSLPSFRKLWTGARRSQ